LVLAALALVLYLPTLDHPFVFDDVWNLQENSAIRPERLDAESLVRAARGHESVAARPLSNLTFALDARISGSEPRSYRRTNLFIHATNAVLVFWLLLQFSGFQRIRLGGSKPEELPARAMEASVDPGWAFFGALLWLVHPAQTQAVTYLHQRSTSLASLFFLASVTLYVEGRRAGSGFRQWCSLGGAGAAAVLAVASKEIALVLPVVILLVEWLFFQELRFSWFAERKAPLAVAGLTMSSLAGFYLVRAWPWIESAYAQAGYTPVLRLLTELRAGVLYLSLLVWPHPSRLNLDHHLEVSRSLLDPLSGALSLALWLLVAVLAVSWARRGRRLAFFGLAWLIATSLMESTLIPVELVAEHRQYLSSVGVLLILLEFLKRSGRLVPGWALASVATLAIAVLSSWTLDRNRVWSDELLLWQDTVRKSPGKARPHNNLGWALARADRRPEAIDAFRTALSIRPSAETHLNLGQALLAEEELEEATRHLLFASMSMPRSFAAQYKLGVVLLRSDRPEEAARSLRDALSLEPESWDARYELANALWLQGARVRAAWQYRKVIAASPAHFRRHHDLAVELTGRGKAARAAECYEDLLAVRPDDARLHYELANLLARAALLDQAIGHCLESIELDPSFEPARRLLVELAGGIQEPRATVG
jgi:tetratricopeptide (TPR) repeat protein